MVWHERFPTHKHGCRKQLCFTSFSGESY